MDGQRTGNNREQEDQRGFGSPGMAGRPPGYSWAVPLLTVVLLVALAAFGAVTAGRALLGGPWIRRRPGPEESLAAMAAMARATARAGAAGGGHSGAGRAVPVEGHPGELRLERRPSRAA